MVPRCARAAALAALLACIPAPALAADGTLVAQLEQARPDPDLPPLTDSVDGLGEPGPEPTPEPTPDPEDPDGGAGDEDLPATGAEPLAVALAGLGLLGAGVGLRRSADDLLEA